MHIFYANKILHITYLYDITYTSHKIYVIAKCKFPRIFSNTNKMNFRNAFTNALFMSNFALKLTFFTKLKIKRLNKIKLINLFMCSLSNI